MTSEGGYRSSSEEDKGAFTLDHDYRAGRASLEPIWPIAYGGMGLTSACSTLRLVPSGRASPVSSTCAGTFETLQRLLLLSKVSM